MRVHHFNCGTMRPPGASLVNPRARLWDRGRLICHCLLVETARSGLVLVDSGFGTGDVEHPEAHHRLFRWTATPIFKAEETAVARIRALGFQPGDVRHIVVTHLDLDHAGGLRDFPQAQVHLHVEEHRAAMNPGGGMEAMRYLPAHWAHGPNWRTHDEAGGEDWLGFKAVRALDEREDEVLLVPLTGHSHGHCGVAVKHDDRWLLHAGDAYYVQDELRERPHCPAGLLWFQRLVQVHRERRLENAGRLRALAGDASSGVEIFCAHDPQELARYSPDAKQVSLGSSTPEG